MARALDAIGDMARMAWWDGSAIGLKLGGLIGLFGSTEADQASEWRVTLL